ncbi:MAG: Ribonuclease [Pseudomonadota bacterium]
MITRTDKTTAAQEAALGSVDLYTDGACKGNPGPGGWGVLMRSGAHEKGLCGGELQTTNNRMELMAVIEGLNALNRACRVRLFTDSQYVKNGIESWMAGWKQKGWKTSAGKPVANQDLWQRLDAARGRHEVAWHWVKGHAGHPDNERADALANQGVDSVLKSRA